MKNKHIFFFAALLALASGCATSSETAQAQMTASFYDIEDDHFSIQAVGPTETVREYIICKAVWFAEKKKATGMSLSNPQYSETYDLMGETKTVPEGWVAVRATAYLSEPNPTRNPFISIDEMADSCRKGWDWYR